MICAAFKTEARVNELSSIKMVYKATQNHFCVAFFELWKKFFKAAVSGRTEE